MPAEVRPMRGVHARREPSYAVTTRRIWQAYIAAGATVLSSGAWLICHPGVFL